MQQEGKRRTLCHCFPCKETQCFHIGITKKLAVPSDGLSIHGRFYYFYTFSMNLTLGLYFFSYKRFSSPWVSMHNDP